MHGKHKNLHFCLLKAYLSASFKSIHIRHANIHYHNIRLKFFCESDCFFSCSCLSNDTDICLCLEKQFQSLAQNIVVIGQKNANKRVFVRVGGDDLISLFFHAFCSLSWCSLWAGASPAVLRSPHRDYLEERFFACLALQGME